MINKPMSKLGALKLPMHKNEYFPFVLKVRADSHKEEHMWVGGGPIEALFIFFFNIFIDYAITVVPFPPFHSTPSCPPPPSHIPPL